MAATSRYISDRIGTPEEINFGGMRQTSCGSFDTQVCSIRRIRKRIVISSLKNHLSAIVPNKPGRQDFES
jgi:hypothetical protein